MNAGLSRDAKIVEDFVHLDMPNVFNAANAVVQVSHAEGLGLAVLEGMSCMKPVITTRASGIEEIIREREICLEVPPKQVEPIAEAIVTLAADRQLQDRLAKAGCRHVNENFSVHQMVKKTENIYMDMLSR